ncbi:hypothetical protein U1Q18_034562 [Sarracenia purpurea var. burkii]
MAMVDLGFWGGPRSASVGFHLYGHPGGLRSDTTDLKLLTSDPCFRFHRSELKLRNGRNDDRSAVAAAASARIQIPKDTSMLKENEALHIEQMKMKMYASNVKINQGSSSFSSSAAPKGGLRRPKFFLLVSWMLGKLNPFKVVSKDTSNIKDDVDITKPRRRRFSLS